MKKFVALLLVICVAFAVFVSIKNYEPKAKTEEESVEESVESAAEPVMLNVDFDAMYALHDPEEIVMTIDGRDISWAEYFFVFYLEMYRLLQIGFGVG